MVLFILPLTIAATLLPRNYVWALAAMTVLCYSVLLAAYVPLAPARSALSEFGLHVLGMWLAFVLVAGLAAYFVVRMGDSLRERDRELAAAREQTLRDQRLVALGTLAAGTAHQLGTPLGTMSLLLEELERGCDGRSSPQAHRGLAELREQLERCKETLATLSAPPPAECAWRADGSRPPTAISRRWSRSGGKDVRRPA